jgi:hypothetical protein
MISDMINSVYRINFGMTAYDWVNTFPVIEVDSESAPYEWMLQGEHEKNYSLVRAEMPDSTTITSASTGVGKGLSQFYLVFEEDFLAIEDIAVGEVEHYHYFVKAKEKTGNLTKYLVELIADSYDTEVDPEELLSGRKFSKDYNLKSTNFSTKGTELEYTSPFRMANRPSFMRLRYEVPGSMIRMGKNDPLEFKFNMNVNGQNKQASTWINYQDMVADWTMKGQFARMSIYGRKNWTSNDLILNKDSQSKYEVVSGAGLFQQVDPSNRHYYNKFNIDQYVDYVLDRSVGRIDRKNRKITIFTGEFGARTIHRSIEAKTGSWSTIMMNPGLFNKVSNNDLGTNPQFGFGGQWSQYRSVNGVQVDVAILPFMDDEIRFKAKHPTDSGVVESHRMIAFDFGGDSEIYRIKIKGQEDVWNYIPGLRDPFSAGGKGQPKLAVSELDAYIINRAMWGGMVVKDPTRIIDWQYNFER